MKHKYLKWTEEQKQLAHKLYKIGYSPKEMAVIMTNRFEINFRETQMTGIISKIRREK